MKLQSEIPLKGMIAKYFGIDKESLRQLISKMDAGKLWADFDVYDDRRALNSANEQTFTSS